MVVSSGVETPPMHRFAWILSCCIILCNLHIAPVATAFSRPFSAPLHATPSCRRNRVAFATNSPNDSNGEKSAAEELLEKARKFREDVAAIESSKSEVARAEQQERDAVRREKDDTRMRYSAEVPILKDMGEEVMERVDFPPRLAGGKSRIVTCQASLPLGLILGEDEQLPGITTVDEVGPDSNGEFAGVKAGDLLRAVTACQTTMETPTWQLLAGGIGQPKTKRFMYSVDGRPFEEVMNAVGSNRMDPSERPVWLVLERVE